jgi:hypothetical protein
MAGRPFIPGDADAEELAQWDLTTLMRDPNFTLFHRRIPPYRKESVPSISSRHRYHALNESTTHYRAMSPARSSTTCRRSADS